MDIYFGIIFEGIWCEIYGHILTQYQFLLVKLLYDSDCMNFIVELLQSLIDSSLFQNIFTLHISVSIILLLFYTLIDAYWNCELLEHLIGKCIVFKFNFIIRWVKFFTIFGELSLSVSIYLETDSKMMHSNNGNIHLSILQDDKFDW